MGQVSNCAGLGTTVTALSCSTPAPSGSCKKICSSLFPSSLVRRFHFVSLLMSWWRPNQFKTLRWGWPKADRGWVLGRFPTGTLWEPLKQVSANCSSFEAAVTVLQNLMKLLGCSWGNLDVKDICLTAACCSVGRTYSPKYLYFHYPSVSQELGLSNPFAPGKEQRHSTHIQSTDCRVVSNAWDRFKIHSGYSL